MDRQKTVKTMLSVPETDQQRVSLINLRILLQPRKVIIHPETPPLPHPRSLPLLQSDDSFNPCRSHYHTSVGKR